MEQTIKTIESLLATETLKEIEMMLTTEELRLFGAYCLRNDIKFNDWVRQLAHDVLREERLPTGRPDSK